MSAVSPDDIPTPDEDAESSCEDDVPDVDLSDVDLEQAFSLVMADTDSAINAAEQTIGQLVPGDHPADENRVVDSSTVRRARLDAREVIEAVLFVGPDPLSTRRLAKLLETDDLVAVDAIIDALNAQYDVDRRPYEIQHREGGYLMRLRRSFEPVRDRVYGTQGREVTLPQEIVELLAVVAYEQPLSLDRLAALPRKSAKRGVSQLIRRGLVELREVQGEGAYVTTDRFLDVLGLRELEDLPQPEVLSIR